MYISITYKSYMLTVRRPRWGIHRTLPAIKVGQYLWFAAGYRQQPDVNMFIRRMYTWFNLSWKKS